MFGRVSSAKLLSAATKAETVAQKSLAIAQAAQASAAKKRELAKKLEEKERLVSLDKNVSAAQLIVGQTSAEYTKALNEKYDAEALLAAAEKKVKTADEALQVAVQKYDIARKIAFEERDRLGVK